MKIITEEAVYIQKNDIEHLYLVELPIPSSIFIKVFGNGVITINDDNRYDFIRFSGEKEIEFFKSLDWIIDYNEVKDLDKEGILNMFQTIAKEQKKLKDTFNEMDDENKKNNSALLMRYYLSKYKFYFLRDYLWFKEGHIKMNLPEGFGENNCSNKTIKKDFR